MERTQRITCVSKAIKDGTLKGKFTSNRHTWEFPPVENIDAKGNKSNWKITVTAFDTDKKESIPISTVYYTCPILAQPPSNIIAKIITKIKRHTGHEQINEETIVDKGKNLGKLNASTPISQAITEAFRKYENKAKNANTKIHSSDARPFPMALQKSGTTKKATLDEEDFKNGVLVQPKLDGIRTIAHILSNQTVEFYSRKGNAFSGLNHIACEVLHMIINQKDYKDTQIYIDGEVYIHGTPLQELSGAIRGEDNALKQKLVYNIFDCFVMGECGILPLPQNKRYDLLKQMYKKKYKHIKLVSTEIIHSPKELEDIYNGYIKDGYEGVIARRSDGLYKSGVGSQRSSDVLKIKPFSTDEYEVVDYKEGRGRDKCAITFILKTSNGDEFAAVPNDTIENRKILFKKLEDNKNMFQKKFKGKMATIQYADLSNKGVPTQPKFIALRTYE
jgi:ATP-dependent DNA ligase